MYGRSALQDSASPVRDGRSRYGADRAVGYGRTAKAFPSKLQAQTPPPTGPPWPGLAGQATGGAAAAPRFAMVNTEQMLPVVVVRLGPPLAAGRHNQARIQNRLRSSYALLPTLGGSQSQ